MHLLIPFACSSSEGCAAVLPSLRLPHLHFLLSRMVAQPPDCGPASSLCSPHERALARTLGLPVTDGLIPLAARQAAQQGKVPINQSGGWAFVTPCHWQVNSNHITMDAGTLVDFSEQEAIALLTAMRPYFEQDGLELHYFQPTTWLARGPLFDGLPTASLDRVLGSNLENWMPRSASAVHLRRLQNEMQMLLYAHPVNDARVARGVLPVNSFWLSGTGAIPPGTPALPAPQIAEHLRAAALGENWPVWAQAWETLDAHVCAPLREALQRSHQGPYGDPLQITLCGPCNAQTFTAAPRSLVHRITQAFGRFSIPSVLEAL